MLDEIDYPAFLEWMAMAELSPFTAEREEYRTANIVQAIVNMNRDVKKRREPWPIEQFVLRFGDMPAYKKRQTPEEQKAIARMFYMAFNQPFLDKDKQNAQRGDRPGNIPSG
jgi:hypothetical protein